MVLEYIYVLVDSFQLICNFLGPMFRAEEEYKSPKFTIDNHIFWIVTPNDIRTINPKKTGSN